MSLDTEEVVEFTDVEQSDSEYESEGSSETHGAIDSWKFEANPSFIDHQPYPDEFIAELHRAADILDVQSADTNWPFASALDVPLIKQEREENTVDNAEYYGEIMEEETEDEAREEDTVNHLCRSTMMSGIGVSSQELEEVYFHGWTGM